MGLGGELLSFFFPFFFSLFFSICNALYVTYAPTPNTKQTNNEPSNQSRPPEQSPARRHQGTGATEQES
jgi:hypothetical protein